jgi:hypothetical protein
MGEKSRREDTRLMASAEYINVSDEREKSAAARQQFTRQKLWRTAALDLDEQLPLPTLFSADFLIHSTVFVSFRAREINKQDVNRAHMEYTTHFKYLLH